MLVSLSLYIPDGLHWVALCLALGWNTIHWWVFWPQIHPSTVIPSPSTSLVPSVNLPEQPRYSHLTECGEWAPPLAKVMRKEAWHTQKWDQASGVSLEILKQSTPKTRVCLLSALCFHLHLWLYRGCPPLPLSEKRVSLQLQLIIPGCDSVSTYKLLWKSSSLPE